MSVIKRILQLLVLWLSACLILTLGVVAAYCIPVKLVESNAIDSVDYNNADLQSIVDRDKTTEASTTTMSIMLSMATHCDEGPLKSAMRGGYFLDDEMGVNDSVRLGVQETCNRHYEWYWHGWIVLLKPMLAIMDYGGIKKLTWSLFVVLTTLLSVRLSSSKNHGFWFGIALSVPILYTGSNSIDCFPYAVPLLLAIGTSVLITYINWQSAPEKLGTVLFLVFFAVGCLTCYLDFLVTPLITFIVPAVVCVIYMQGQQWSEKLSIWFKLYIQMGASWLFGYVGMFLGRWIIASIVLRENIVSLGLNQVVFRMGAEGAIGNGDTEVITQSNGLEITPYNSVLVNLKAMFPVHTVAICVIGAVLVAILLVISFKRGKSLTALTLVFFACLPILWYAVLPNHSIIHNYFTYRLLVGTVFSVFVLAIMVVATERWMSFDNQQS